MHLPINVKSPNNISKWQVGFNSAFKWLICTSARAVTYVDLPWFGALQSVMEVRTLGKFPLHNRKTGPVHSHNFFYLNRKLIII
jgi:hypothetical protein